MGWRFFSFLIFFLLLFIVFILFLVILVLLFRRLWWGQHCSKRIYEFGECIFGMVHMMCMIVIFHYIILYVYPPSRRDLRGLICFLFQEWFEIFFSPSPTLLQINYLISELIDDSLHAFHIHWLLVLLS